MNEDVTLARWLNNEMDDKELQDFMSAPEYTTYSKIKDYSAQLKAPEADIDTLYKNITLAKDKANQPKVRSLSPWLPRIAAMLILTLGVAFFLYASHTTNQHTGAGQRDTFLLPDNSQVVLNSGSEAAYKAFNWGGNRRLELNGEAYFKAAKGKTFDVVTPLGIVTVVGTQFNVKARNGRLDVTCYEGMVQVVSGNNSVLLTPGKSVAYKNGKNINLTAEGINTQPGWISHEALFNTENLENIISELERQYNTTIKLNVSTIPTKHYTGMIPTNNMATALDILQAVYHLKSAKAGNTIILSSE
jgi:transmembrane sensor